MQIIIYDKTDKGREEIATRKWHLPSRMRSLLVLIDGKQSDAQLVKKIGGLGLSEQSLLELQENGFIQRVSIESAETELLDGRDSLDLTTPTTLGKLADSTLGSIEESQTIFEASEEETAAWRADLNALLSANSDDGPRESRVDMMKRYLAELIKENLGIKGFFLQRKLLKASTLYDIHAFRHPYISAILHAKGKDKAVALRDEFDERMYVSFSLDDPEFLED